MSDFKTVLVKDSVIGDITADLDFAVKSGASQTTYQRFPSTSSSNSALIYNVQVPSENVVIGRDVLLNTGLTIELTYTGAVAGQTVFSYGMTDAFQAFPINSLFTTATAQINNTTVSINSKDVLPSILRMNNSRELYRYNSLTPCLPDQAYGLYADGVQANNNPLADYGTASYDLDQVPRGAFPALIQFTRNGGALTQAPDGTIVAPVGGLVTDVYKISVQTVVTEPILLSPFIWSDPEFNCQGLLGINNMAFTFNIDSTASRVWSTASPYYQSIALGSTILSVSNVFASAPAIGALVPATSPSLLFRFLSTQPSDLIQTKNIVPYMDFPRYLTSSANNITVQPNIPATLTSSNLQINQIPDLFIVTVRKPMSSQTPEDSRSNLIINSISINLNNQSGLLSSSSQQDLWRLSERNGSSQSWAEFSGQAFSRGAGGLIASTGSILVLSPPYDLSLPDYITSGSLGNYNFQFTVNVSNQFGVNITPEICVVCVNSGIFSTQQGVSAVYTGILTKEMVLASKASQQASAMKSREVKRMVGGNILNTALSAIGSLLGDGRRHKGGAMGMASSGGAMGMASSGGLMGMSQSGGRLKKFH